jgi:hypothetical protein
METLAGARRHHVDQRSQSHVGSWNSENAALSEHPDNSILGSA